MSGLLTTPEARISYPTLATARAMKNPDGTLGEAKYSGALLFTVGQEGKFLPGLVSLDEMAKAAMEVALEKFGPARLEALRKADKFRSPFRKDGELKGYPAGTIYINTTSTTKPGVVDGFNRLLNDAESKERVYAGSYVRAMVKPYAYDKMGNTGVSFGLINVQLLGDGERLDGRQSATEAFSAVAVDIADIEAPAEIIATAPKGAVKKVQDLL